MDPDNFLPTGWPRFELIIWFLDKSIPGGAFTFPGERPRTIIDYLFLSFNTSSTYGPTIEVPTSQGAKVLMMAAGQFVPAHADRPADKGHQ